MIKIYSFKHATFVRVPGGGKTIIENGIIVTENNIVTGIMRENEQLETLSLKFGVRTRVGDILTQALAERLENDTDGAFIITSEDIV